QNLPLVPSRRASTSEPLLSLPPHLQVIADRLETETGRMIQACDAGHSDEMFFADFDVEHPGYANHFWIITKVYADTVEMVINANAARPGEPHEWVLDSTVLMSHDQLIAYANQLPRPFDAFGIRS
ncbi:MAG: hypothetical protein GY898_16360, partial [Proteobacteria bacterium]|nr:hypothetical protein [Pseudomonadota bacterium]